MTPKKPDDPLKENWKGKYLAASRRVYRLEADLREYKKDLIVTKAKYAMLRKLADKAGIKPDAEIAALLREAD